MNRPPRCPDCNSPMDTTPATSGPASRTNASIWLTRPSATRAPSSVSP